MHHKVQWVYDDPISMDIFNKNISIYLYLILLFQNDTIRLLWAVYEEDPMDEDRGALLWHGRGSRGVQSVHLITPPLPQPQDEAMKAWEIRQDNVRIMRV